MAAILPLPVLPEAPDWLSDHWRDAAERLAGAVLPSTDEEEWRYSPIGTFDPQRFPVPTEPHVGSRPEALSAILKSLPPHAGGVVLVDGTVVVQHLDPDLAERGVRIGPAADLADGGGLLDGGAPSDLFAAAADAGTGSPIVVQVPAGVTVDRPLVVIHWAEQAGTTGYGRVVVDIGADAEATVLEIEASAPVEALRSHLLDLRVGSAARLRYLNLQQLGPRMQRIATHRSTVADQATLQVAQVALGGAYARTRTECRMQGRGGTGDLLALYFGAGDQVLDFRTFQHHEAPDTTSNLLYKGAVGDRSHSVYTGLITVAPEGRGTNAFQTNRNLKLSDDAWADSVPNLEIETNDVRCSHASTVGPIDEEQRFYLESRGIPPQVADRLIVTGFFDEMLDLLPVPELRPALHREVVERFAASDHSDTGRADASGAPREMAR